MANLFGSLVGALINAATGFAAVPNRFANGSNTVLVRDTATTAGNVIGDTITLGVFKSTAYIDRGSTMWWGAFGAGCTLNVGDVNHPNGLNAALAVANAGTGPLMTEVPGNIGQPLWQALGYASDPGGTLTLLATFAGANPANHALDWQIMGQNS